ncbi:dTMP kinase [Micromonospora matsumotoense]|uniref:dTMP kinase n=1 Tax=Micromonospora matsumotoense TaxID=121616 RepID=UPI00159F236B|nr:dTMP kinase [Micromonospora matsumotoense]
MTAPSPQRRKLDEADVQWLIDFAARGLTPDLTVLLDAPPEVGLARVLARRGANRLDAESLEFHQRVRARFLDMAASHPARYLVVPADAPIDQVAGAIAQRVDELLAARARPGGPRVAV